MAVQEIYQLVLVFKQDEIQDLVQAEIDADTEVSSILNDSLIAAMIEVGLWVSWYLACQAHLA
jgi:methanogenic corrinoid protein MtbC1